MGLDWSSLQQVDVLPGPVGARFASVSDVSSTSGARTGTTNVSAVASAVVTQANGNDVILPDGTVYQRNDDGTYSWIPDVATGNAMHLDWNNLEAVDELPGPVGIPFQHA